ncbi:MAG: hypothetical protein GY696_11275, partial [Gammaproteobacteria bacterium]|nr:hypothetical protein [Gammaproteobacteria bacterium]
MYQVKVWDRFRELVFSTEPAIKVLHLYLDNSHYDVIGYIKQFHNGSYFCEVCNKAYKRAEDHLCPDKCPECRKSPACTFKQWIFCPDCNRNFRNQSCYGFHRQLKTDNKGNFSSICKRLKRCKLQLGDRECGVLLKREEIKDHRCGCSKCQICGEMAKMEEHQCFMAPTKPLTTDA